jgi:hypothetical protein
LAERAPYTFEYGERRNASRIGAADLKFREHQSETNDGRMHISLSNMSRGLLESKVRKYA